MPRWLLLAACLAAAPLPAAAQLFNKPPVPVPRRELVPPIARDSHLVWQRGHYEWNAATNTYDWYRGRLIVRRPGTTRFVPGRWIPTGGDWAWRKSRWR